LLDLTRSRQLVADATAQLSAGNIEAARATASLATKKSDENDEAWVAVAAAELKAGHRAAALDGVRRAIALNPANRRQLARNANFASLRDDAEFKRILAAARNE
jgi:Flp pilus assembly protein TadD